MPSRYDTVHSCAGSSRQRGFAFDAEAWKPIEGWPGYDVSDHGRVRSWRGEGGHRGAILDRCRLLTPKQNANGTVWVSFARGGKPISLPLHRVVLETFVGPRPHAHECRYLDGNPANCDIRNLEWRLPPEFAAFPEERWLPVAGWGGIYEVSDLGRVRTWTCRSRQRDRGDRPTLLGSGDVHGYRIVNLKYKGRYAKVLIHRLVLEAFVGPCPESMECRHLNGNRDDNCLGDLCWGTKSENLDDQFRHGTRKRAEPVREWEPILFFDPFIPWEAVAPREYWKTIDGYPGYEVSSVGRVRSYWSPRGRLRDSSRMLKCRNNSY